MGVCRVGGYIGSVMASVADFYLLMFLMLLLLFFLLRRANNHLMISLLQTIQWRRTLKNSKLSSAVFTPHVVTAGGWWGRGTDEIKPLNPPFHSHSLKTENPSLHLWGPCFFKHLLLPSIPGEVWQWEKIITSCPLGDSIRIKHIANIN